MNIKKVTALVLAAGLVIGVLPVVSASDSMSIEPYCHNIPFGTPLTAAENAALTVPAVTAPEGIDASKLYIKFTSTEKDVTAELVNGSAFTYSEYSLGAKKKKGTAVSAADLKTLAKNGGTLALYNGEDAVMFAKINKAPKTPAVQILYEHTLSAWTLSPKNSKTPEIDPALTDYQVAWLGMGNTFLPFNGAESSKGNANYNWFNFAPHNNLLSLSYYSRNYTIWEKTGENSARGSGFTDVPYNNYLVAVKAKIESDGSYTPPGLPVKLKVPNASQITPPAIDYKKEIFKVKQYTFFTAGCFGMGDEGPVYPSWYVKPPEAERVTIRPIRTEDGAYRLFDGTLEYAAARESAKNVYSFSNIIFDINTRMETYIDFSEERCALAHIEGGRFYDGIHLEKTPHKATTSVYAAPRASAPGENAVTLSKGKAVLAKEYEAYDTAKKTWGALKYTANAEGVYEVTVRAKSTAKTVKLRSADGFYYSYTGLAAGEPGTFVITVSADNKKFVVTDVSVKPEAEPEPETKNE